MPRKPPSEPEPEPAVEEPSLPVIFEWNLPQIPISTCAKCGATRESYSKVVHHKGVDFDSACWRIAGGAVEGWERFPEHLCVTCHKCAYQWVEATKDADQ